jgi:phage terminase small subunit
LNIRQRRFVAEYLGGASGAEAARRAGYSTRNARQQAYDLLTQPYIRTAIAETPRPRKLSPDEVVAELEVLAESSIKDLWDGERMMLPEELPIEVARAVKKFKVRPNGAVEIEMHDQLKVLGLLLDLYRLLEQRR